MNSPVNIVITSCAGEVQTERGAATVGLLMKRTWSC